MLSLPAQKQTAFCLPDLLEFVCDVPAVANSRLSRLFQADELFQERCFSVNN